MNLDINKEEHFKLYILSEHRFTFESELNKRGIDFYSDAEEQVFSSHSIRYYLKNSDREQIDQIIVNSKIDSVLDTISGQSNKHAERVWHISIMMLALAALALTIVFIPTV